MLRIWGRMSSINVRKVVWTVQALGLTHQRTDAGGQFGIVQTPEYLARNPNAVVPLLEDGPFTLWESNVIVRYLCAKHSDGQLYPGSLEGRFDAERWMDWQQTTLNGAGREAFIQLVRTPESERNVQAVAASQAATEPLLALLDAQLQRLLRFTQCMQHAVERARQRADLGVVIFFVGDAGIQIPCPYAFRRHDQFRNRPDNAFRQRQSRPDCNQQQHQRHKGKNRRHCQFQLRLFRL